jgi:large subunit ribosomal protein L22
MEVYAIARFVRMSPRKVRLVTGMLRGLKLDVARTQLAFLPKAASLPVLEVLNSAAANAVNNFKLDESTLIIKTATADQGPALKRWRARAMGRAAPIKKRTTHITIVLTDGKAAIAKAPETKKPVEEAKKIETVKADKKETKKEAPKAREPKEKAALKTDSEPETRNS